MIDLHSHILWGVDDGAKDIEVSEEMAKVAIENDISIIVATPHFRTSKEDTTTASQVVEKVEALNDYYFKNGIDLTIYPGMELYASNDLPDMLKEGKALTLADTRYILLEFSTREIPYFLDDLIYRLKLDGYIPIIAHPERNKDISEDIEILRKLVRKGVYAQVNKGSLLGEFGDRAKQTAIQLLKEGLVHCISTDMHGIERRTPSLDGLKDQLLEVIGEEQIDILLKENPKRVLENRDELIYIGRSIEEKKVEKVTKKTKTKKIAKWKKVLVAVAIALLMLGGVSYYLMNKSVEIIMESIASVETQVLEQALKSDNTLGEIGEPKQSTSMPGSEFGIEPKASGVIKSGIKTEPVKQVSQKQPEKEKAGTPPVSEKFTEGDKARAIKIVYGSVSGAEINRIKAMASDGFTPEEISRAKAILKASLSSSEIEELKVLYRKYINSQKG